MFLVLLRKEWEIVLVVVLVVRGCQKFCFYKH